MIQFQAASLLLVPLLAPISTSPASSVVPALGTTGPASTTAAAPAPRPSASTLEVWNDPSFQKRFMESYLAETEIEPRVTIVERDHMQTIMELMSEDKTDKAVAQLEKYRQGGASAVFDFTLANIWFQQEDFERAAAAYRVAIDKHPKFRRAWKNLGLIQARSDNAAGSIEAFTRAIELGGGDAISYGLLGFAYGNLDNHLSAESAYRMAILLDSSTLDWKLGLTRSLFKQARYADAAALCDVLIGSAPQRADLWLLQANAFIGLGQPLRAAQNYELVDRMGASTVDSLNMLGDIYVNESLFDLATSAYLRALGLNAVAATPRALRAAKSLASRGELDETQQLVDKIESLRGEDLVLEERKDLLKLRARIAVAEGAGGEEARVLEQIVELDPLDGEALLLLGQHAERSGDPEKAIFWFERAASLDGFEADAKVRHAQLLATKQGRYAEALPLLRRAQDLNFRENVQDFLEQVENLAKSR